MSSGLVRLAFFLVLCSSAALAQTRRIAIVVGNNARLGNLPPLRYAESDAGKMARALVELGDVWPDEMMLLQGLPLADLEWAIAEAKEQVSFFERSPDVRSVLLELGERSAQLRGGWRWGWRKGASRGRSGWGRTARRDRTSPGRHG